MLRSKKWLVVFICTLALLITFSTSPGSAHAASSTNHAHPKPLVKVIPNMEGPPGCVAIQLGDFTNNVNYQGHGFQVENQLLGWYVSVGDSFIFCDEIFCVADINYTGGSPVPAGIIEVQCGFQPTASKRTNPTTGGDGISQTAKVTAGREPSCAKYWIGGTSGPSFNTDGGCDPGQTLRLIPASI